MEIMKREIVAFRKGESRIGGNGEAGEKDLLYHRGTKCTELHLEFLIEKKWNNKIEKRLIT